MRWRTIMCLAIAVPQAIAAAPSLRILSTPGGVRFGIVGAKPVAPQPTVFFLGGGVEESLTEPQYAEAEEELGSDVLCVTIDLPGHGRERVPGEPASIPAWRFRLDRGQDLIADVTKRGTEVLDYLVQERYSDPSRVAIFGTSRGGFMAFHFAAVEPRVRQIAAFAPVTDLLALREFWGMEDDHRARSLAAIRLVPRLVDRGMWLIIGSTDHRVGSQQTVEFARRMVEEAEARGSRPELELHVEPTEGHRVPAGCYARAARWLKGQWSLR